MKLTDDEAERNMETANAYLRRAVERLGWIFDGSYPEPSEELKPFVFALMDRAVDQNDDEAVAALEKLFPPRPQ